MTKREKEAAMRRWMGQIYHNRGYELVPEVWDQFKAFYENIGWWDDVNPGVRVDGQDKWDILEKRLVDEPGEIIV